MGQDDPYFKFDRASRSRLVGRLLLFQKITRSRIFLVFDGRPPVDGHFLKLNAKFTVLFPQPGQSADRLIEELLSQKKDRRYFLVVSSDRGVKDIARTRGTKTISSDEFLKELKRLLKEKRKDRELEKQNENSTPLEISIWDELLTRTRK